MILIIILPLYFTYFNGKSLTTNDNHIVNEIPSYIRNQGFHSLYFFRDFGLYLIVSLLNCIFIWSVYKIDKIPRKNIKISGSIIFFISLLSIIVAIVLISISSQHLIATISLFIIFTVIFSVSLITIYTLLFLKLKSNKQVEIKK
ncbi:Uncharacterised protein [Metamycoplasma cloacale]|uniref:Uncharacterized protein n=1 Tax=Metamycoplasma cloacale TaxID=92401 RepID=A0A2Z4LME9_9BACT|nr:hypothetical protein [Metamycoplasma cloacale]AWX42953.1 hypothetical protein DK849_02690 [Metamycoplasma cloacale]VEU79223.1 Uncharacterised protein [Metamycoplasma cloacale]